MIPRHEEHLVYRHHLVDGLATQELQIVAHVAVARVKSQRTLVGYYRLRDVAQTILAVAEIVVQFRALACLQQFGIASRSLLIVALGISSGCYGSATLTMLGCRDGYCAVTACLLLIRGIVSGICTYRSKAEAHRHKQQY